MVLWVALGSMERRVFFWMAVGSQSTVTDGNGAL